MDKRFKTPAQKARTKRERLDRRNRRHREREWIAAAHAADQAGSPVNFLLTLSLHHLADEYGASERFLGLSSPENQELRIWAALRRVAQRHGVQWLALRAPEHDRTKQRHVHIGAYMPSDRALRDAIASVERITGVSAGWIDSRGRSLGRWVHGVVAKSPGGAWMIQRDVIGERGNPHLIAYLAKGSGKRRVEGQHRLSQDLRHLAAQHMTRATV
jgi:hypothetical protein